MDQQGLSNLVPDGADGDREAISSVGPDLGMLDRVERELDDVERVLPRLDDGTYGTCEACGGAIGDTRLSESPATRFCAEHAVP